MTDAKKLRLLILSPGLPVPPVKGGAIETIIHETSPFYRHAETWVFSENADLPANLRSDHGNVKYVQVKTGPFCSKIAHFLNRAARRGFFSLYDRRFIRKVVRLMPGAPDVLHIHNNLWCVTFFKKKYPHTRIVLHMHNDFLFEWPRLRLKYRRILEKVDRIIVVSDYLKRRLGVHDPEAAKKTVVVHNGISMKTFARFSSEDARLKPWMAKIGLKDGERCVIFVGRLHPTKGPHILMRAFKALEPESRGLKLLIVGSSWFAEGKMTPYLKDLHRMMEDMRESVIFTGFVSHEELNVLYNLADVCVIPSIFQDPCPLTVFEAMASGCAVIASKVGGIPEMVRHGETGILVPAEDPEALTAALRELLDHSSLRRDLRENALQFIRQHGDWSVFAEKIEWVYREAIGVTP